MLKTRVAELFKNEETVRGINRSVTECMIDQLVRDDLDSEEKAKVVKYAKDSLDTSGDWEKRNSEYWYEYGIGEGMIKGMLLSAGIFVAGSVISVLRNK